MFSGKSVLISDLLAVNIFNKKIVTLKQQLLCGSVIDASFECCFNLFQLVVINFIIRGAVGQ